MKTQEVRELTPEEIRVKVGQLSKQLVEMKMQFCNNPGAVKTSEFRKTRKTIARLLTVQRARVLNISGTKQPVQAVQKSSSQKSPPKKSAKRSTKI